jgi:ribose transport system substrate-binding protein
MKLSSLRTTINAKGKRRAASLAAACCVAALGSACSSAGSGSASSGGSVSAPAPTGTGSHLVDVGLASRVKVSGHTLNIAYLAYGDVNTYEQANIKGAEDAAKAAGAGLTVFNSNEDPTTQLNQVQDVLTSGRYNGIVIQALDGQQVCTQMTKQAEAAGILVVDITEPLCGTDSVPIGKQWVAGTVGNFVPVDTDYYVQWIQQTLAEDPGATQIGVLAGPALSPTTAQLEIALKQVLASHPSVKVVATYNTDFTQPAGLTDTQALLQAHPGVNLILSQSGGPSLGAAEAVSMAGKTGKVLVADTGGSKDVVAKVLSGAILNTAVQSPANETKYAIETLSAAFNGQALPYGRSAVVDFDGSKVQVITKQDASAFSPQF